MSNKGIKITCNCGRTFRWIPVQKFNSTIKPKAPTECRICINTRLLSKSTLNSKDRKNSFNSGNSSKKRKKSSKSLAMENADKWFSLYIRIKYAYKIQDGEVYCQCIVNRSVIKLAKHMDNGHFRSRGYQATRYWENNCRPQNRSSNRFKGELDHDTFGDHLKIEIGPEAFDELNLMYRQETMVSEEYFLEIAKKYRVLVNELVKEHSIKKWW